MYCNNIFIYYFHTVWPEQREPITGAVMYQTCCKNSLKRQLGLKDWKERGTDRKRDWEKKREEPERGIRWESCSLQPEATSSPDALFEPQKGLDIPPIVLKQRTPQAQDPMGLREERHTEKGWDCNFYAYAKNWCSCVMSDLNLQQVAWLYHPFYCHND